MLWAENEAWTYLPACLTHLCTHMDTHTSVISGARRNHNTSVLHSPTACTRPKDKIPYFATQIPQQWLHIDLRESYSDRACFLDICFCGGKVSLPLPHPRTWGEDVKSHVMISCHMPGTFTDFISLNPHSNSGGWGSPTLLVTKTSDLKLMPIYSRFQATSKFRENVGRDKLFQMHFSHIPRVDLMPVCVFMQTHAQV